MEQNGTGCDVTVMVFWQVVLPPAPSAVIVYVVVVPGDTDFEPEPAVTAPMP